LSGSKLLITILVVCLIVVFGYQMIDYFKQQREQVAIFNQTRISNQTLALLTKPPQDLNQRLVESKLANQIAEKSVTIDKINSTDVIDSILRTADICGLKVTPLTTNQWLKKSLAGSTYRMLPIEVNVEGKLSDLTTFIARLEDRNSFPSLVIQDLSISGNEQVDGIETVIGNTSIVSAKLTLSIITRLETAR
jgi:Tfp pilus assembly protein PilO